MYTDGPKSVNGVRWAVNFRTFDACELLLGSASIFTAELMAILRSVKSVAECWRPGRRFLVYSDPKSTVEAPRSLIFLHPPVRAIYDGLAQVARVGVEVTFCFFGGGCAQVVPHRPRRCPALL